MGSAKRCFGLFHVAMAAAVATQALTSESYDAELSNTVWLVLNWLMAVAVITALVFSYQRWRSADAAASAWISSRVLLIACALLMMLYFEHWSSEFGVGADGLSLFRRSMWLFIDTLFVLVNVTVGKRLLRGQ